MRKPKERGLDEWEEFKGFLPSEMGAQAKDVADTRRALTRKEVIGKKTAGARLAAKGYQDPDPEDGNVATPECVNEMSRHLRLISLGPRRNGRSGVRENETPSIQRAGLAARYLYKPRTHGIPMIPAA